MKKPKIEEAEQIKETEVADETEVEPVEINKEKPQALLEEEKNLSVAQINERKQ